VVVSMWTLWAQIPQGVKDYVNRVADLRKYSAA